MAVAEHGEDQVCPFAHVQGGPADGIESLWLECDRRWVSGTSARPSLCRCPSCHEQGELFNPMASHVWNRASRYSHANMDLADCPKAPLARLQAMTNGPGYCNIEAARLKKEPQRHAMPRFASPCLAHASHSASSHSASTCCLGRLVATPMTARHIPVCLVFRLQTSGPEPTLQRTRVLVLKSPSVLPPPSFPLPLPPALVAQPTPQWRRVAALVPLCRTYPRRPAPGRLLGTY
jgi:hypothetical protein